MKVAIHLTHDCNMRCTYCYVGKKYDKRMSLETAREAVRFAYENSTQRVDISFFGGEPLLEKELILETIDYSNEYRKTHAIEKPVRYFVTTNGLALDQVFLAAAQARQLNIALSLDGHGQGHDLTRTLPDGTGSFELLSRQFPMILAANPAIEILVTFTPANLPFLAEGIEKLYYCGFKIFMIGPNYEEDWSPPSLETMRLEYQKLARFYEERFDRDEYIYISTIDGKIASHARLNCEICSCCDKNDGEIAVAPSGNLYPCLRFVKGDEDSSLVIGTLKDGLNKKRRAKIMMEAAREWPECADCGYRGRCFHYCSAVNFKLGGAFNKPSPALCVHEQTAITVADEVGASLYKKQNRAFLKRFYGG